MAKQVKDDLRSMVELANSSERSDGICHVKDYRNYNTQPLRY